MKTFPLTIIYHLQFCHVKSCIVYEWCMYGSGPYDRYYSGKCMPGSGPYDRYYSGKSMPGSGPYDRYCSVNSMPGSGPYARYWLMIRLDM